MFNIDDFYRNAATFDELLSDDFYTDPALVIDSQRVNAILKAWCAASASGNWDAFVLRLLKDGWSLDFVSARLAGARPKRALAYPLWVRDAQWVLQNLQLILLNVAPDPLSSQSHDAKVERLLMEFAQLAQNQFTRSLSHAVLAGISDRALSDLRATLVRELRTICVKPLTDYFTELKKITEQGSGLDTYLELNHDEQGFQLGLQTKLIELFNLQPVSLRLSAVVTRKWMDATETLIQRLYTDQRLLRDQFSFPANGFELLGVQSTNTDTKILEYCNNKKIVYVSRNYDLTQRVFAWVKQLNHHAPPIDLKCLNVISGTGYSWFEAVEPKPPTNESEHAQLYQKLGAWMAVLYVLAGSRLEEAQFLCMGANPVPLEIQCLFQVDVVEDGSEVDPDDEATSAAMDINRSIAQLSALPFNLFRTVETFTNLDQYFDHLLDGFKRYLFFIMECRDQVGVDGLLKTFENQLVRVQYKSNNFYTLLLTRMKNAAALSDGALWSVQSDFLARFFDVSSVAKRKWADLRIERQALIQLQTPFFTERLPARITPEQTEPLNVVLEVPAIEYGSADLSIARQRLDRLTAHTIYAKCALLRAVLWPSVSYNRSLKNTKYSGHESSSQNENQFFLNEAKHIAKILTDLAVPSSGNFTWHRFDPYAVNEQRTLINEHSLYCGNLGIAIFLAAHAKVTCQAESLKLSLEAVADLREIINSSAAAAFATTLGLGGATGLGSIVYGLTVQAKLLNEPALLADATQAARLFSVELISNDRALDVIAGSAGAILGLLKLYRETRESFILERAVLCGNHLLSQARYNEHGRRYWAGELVGDKSLNGMSHGASGFGYAFALLAKASGQNKFLAALEESLKNEDENFNHKVSNWFLLDKDAPLKKPPCQWCHGAVGIGIARMAIATQGAPDLASLEVDITRALRGASLRGHHLNDSMCCGSLGHVELLRSASLFFSNPTFDVQAKAEFKKVIDRAHRSGKYLLGPPGEIPLGLFTGLAGIGYSALRHNEPTLPNILIWE